MNKIYRLVWNRACNRIDVASELTRSHSRRGGAGSEADSIDEMPPVRRRPRLAFKLAPIALVLGSLAAMPVAYAAPVDCDDAGTNSLQCGPSAAASGAGATALGPSAKASGAGATALGQGANASGEGGIALGSGANDGGTDQGATTATNKNSIAIGHQAGIQISNGVAWQGNDNIGIGTKAGGAIKGDGNIAIGRAAGTRSGAEPVHNNTVSIGYNAIARENDGVVALGANTYSKGKNSVALGAESTAMQDNVVSVGHAANDPRLVLGGTWGSALTRRIINVSAGIADTDAVNVSQLKPLVTGLGGGTAIDATTGAVTGPTYTVGGNTYTNVGDALAAAAASGSGGATHFYGVNSSDTTDSNYSGAGATGANALAAGTSASATGDSSVAIGNASKALLEGQISIGNGVNSANQAGANAISIGTDSITNAADAVALGHNASVKGAAGASVALGANSLADRTNSIAVGRNGAERQIIYVAKGTQDTDAVNVSQLKGVTTALGGGAAVDSSGNVTAPSYSIAGGTQTSVAGALTALDNAGVQYDAGSSQGKVTLTGASGTTITNVKDGTIASGSNDAVNGGQLYTTNQNVTANGTRIGTQGNGLAAALGGGAAVDSNGNVTAPSYSVAGGTQTNVGDALTALNNAGIQYDNPTTRDKVTLGGTNGTTLGNVKAGVAAMDAVNVDQLNGLATALGGTLNPNGSVQAPDYTVNGTTYHTVGDAIDASTMHYFSVNNGTATSQAGNTNQNKFNQGASGANAIAVGKGAVAKGTQSLAVGFGNVVSGDHSGAFGDPNVVSGTGSYAVGNNNTIANDNSFVVGNDVATTQDNSVVLGNASTDRAATTEASSTVGGITYGGYAGQGSAANGVVSVGDASKERQVINVASGKVSATSTDAINGSQLYATQQAIGNAASSTATALGGGATVNPDGSISAPSYSIQGSTQHNVGDALGALDTAVTTNSTAISGLAASAADSVQYDTGSSKAKVTLAGAGGTTITNLKDGNVASGSTDAVNGGQLYTTNQNVAANGTRIGTQGAGLASALGGGAAVDGSGNVTAPSYSVAGGTQTNVGDALTALDNAGIQYDNPTTKNRVTLGGTASTDGGATNGTAITNVHQGDVSNGSTDAVNGTQLYNTGNGLVDALGGGAAINPDGTITAPSYAIGGTSYTNVGDALAAVGGAMDSTNPTYGHGATASPTGAAYGSGATASGANSTALGNGAQATGTNSVALGAGSIADRANTVSVGAPGAERQVTNVAPGTMPTDAVNLAQLHGTENATRRYAARGIAAAMAVPSIPYLMPGKQWVGTALGGYGGESAIGVGYAYRANAHLSFGAGLSTSFQNDEGAGGIAYRVQMGWGW